MGTVYCPTLERTHPTTPEIQAHEASGRLARRTEGSADLFILFKSIHATKCVISLRGKYPRYVRLTEIWFSYVVFDLGTFIYHMATTPITCLTAYTYYTRCQSPPIANTEVSYFLSTWSTIIFPTLPAGRRARVFPFRFLPGDKNAQKAMKNSGHVHNTSYCLSTAVVCNKLKKREKVNEHSYTQP